MITNAKPTATTNSRSQMGAGDFSITNIEVKRQYVVQRVVQRCVRVSSVVVLLIGSAQVALARFADKSADLKALPKVPQEKLL